jgi:predicted nicotinamide N-methyase
MSTPAILHETPWEAIGSTIEEKVILGAHTFWMSRPADPDRMLDHPAILAASARDDYMPYWCDLWPAARMLAKAVLNENWPTGLKTLELGCGLGLPGIAALAKGLEVTFSDYDTTALRFAADNARRNGFTQFHTLPLDWRQPPALPFALILAADLIYEERNVAPLVHTLNMLLAPDGLCLLTDQDRKPAPVLQETLRTAGFTFQTTVMHAGKPGGDRYRGTLYRITRAAPLADSRL